MKEIKGNFLRKETLLLLFGVFFINTVFAQNWMPVNKNKIYNYGINDSNICFSLKVDSTKLINSDTVYYFNKLCKRLSIDILLVHQPTFMLSQYTKNDDSIIFYYPKTKKSYKLLLKSNSVFLFDSINNITAQCISRSLITLFNSITDSIYTYRLSNADSIVISKKHGIIKFPLFNNHSHYILVGIENYAGNQMPMFEDFFEFYPGDKFEYLIHHQDRFWWNEITLLRQYIIYQKTMLGDTIYYNCHVKERKIYYNMHYVLDTLYSITEITWTFKNFINSFINKYPEEIFYISPFLVTNVIAEYNSNYFTKEFNNSYRYYSNKDTLIREKPSSCHNYPTTFQDIDPQNFYSMGYSSLAYKYETGLGLIDKGYFTHNGGPSYYGYRLTLTAAKTSSRVYGSFSNDPFFNVGINNVLLKQRILIYPNPVSDILNIETEGNNEKKNVEIFNIAGQVLYKGSMLEKTEIKTNNFLPGVYIIEINWGENIEYTKIVKT